MNETLHTILNHRSIRKFTDQKLTTEQIDTIVEAASHASTSSYLMAYSIIGVTDEDKKEQLTTITNQSYVKNNGHFLLFCADLHRNAINANDEQYQEMQDNLLNTEHFLVASIDAALAAQNAAIAAESLGLGICYIGSIRNNIKQVDELFGLPNHVIPLFGLAIGYPAHQPEQKPRLPKGAIYHENTYSNDEYINQHLTDFDQTIATYYQNRSSNRRMDSWTEQMIRTLSNTKRMDVSSFVQSKHYNKK